MRTDAMTLEDRDRAEAARGAAARGEWTALEAAFTRLRAAMLEEIVASDPAHAERREKLYLACQTLDAVKTALLSAVAAGEAAQMRLIVAESVG